MAKIVASLAAVFFYWIGGTTSVGGDIGQGPLDVREALGVEAPIRAEGVEGASPEASSDATRAAPLQEMSPEEKDRRRDKCARLYDACHDWCMRSNRGAKKQRSCLEEKCIPDLAECMKKIPN
jgi:hypothetical protein